MGTKCNKGEGLQRSSKAILKKDYYASVDTDKIENKVLTNCSRMILNLPTVQETSNRQACEEIKRHSEKLSCVRRTCGELDRCLHSGVIE